MTYSPWLDDEPSPAEEDAYDEGCCTLDFFRAIGAMPARQVWGPMGPAAHVTDEEAF